jgi:hypothetical protein
MMTAAKSNIHHTWQHKGTALVDIEYINTLNWYTWMYGPITQALTHFLFVVEDDLATKTN